MSQRTTLLLHAVLAASAFAVPAAARAQDKELVFGLQCDRTGATQTVGIYLCPGYHDYIDLVNSRGGIEGYKIKVVEIDTISAAASPARNFNTPCRTPTSTNSTNGHPRCSRSSSPFRRCAMWRRISKCQEQP
jgi:hypothetical protein